MESAVRVCVLCCSQSGEDVIFCCKFNFNFNFNFNGRSGSGREQSVAAAAAGGRRRVNAFYAIVSAQ
jgi:hypothetical protein